MCTTTSGQPAISARAATRCTASDSIDAGRVSRWWIGVVSPRATAWSRKASIAMPFSACIITVAPIDAATCMASRIWRSSERFTPGYAVNSLKVVTPARIISGNSANVPS